MKRILKNITDTLADAALLEMGADAAHAPANARGAFREALEEHLTEIAFAEAADYDQIHDAIGREHFKADDAAHSDECQYGDNDICYAN